jgi:hypothetical protein
MPASCEELDDDEEPHAGAKMQARDSSERTDAIRVEFTPA